MAHKRKGQLAKPPQWWKHLKWCKRVFWKRERRLEGREAQAQVEGDIHPAEIRLLVAETIEDSQEILEAME